MSASSPDAVPPAPPHAASRLAESGGTAAAAHGGRQPAGSHPASGGESGDRRTPARIAKDIGLFFAAPYVTLASLAAFPFLGMKLLAQVRRERNKAG